MISLRITTNIDQVIAGVNKLKLNGPAFAMEIIDEIGEQHVLPSAKETCPSPSSVFYPTESTGFLRDSHIYEHMSQSSAVVRPTAYYATFVHEGTVNMPARPWLLLAVNLVKPQIEGMLEAKLTQFVQDAFAEVRPLR